MDQFHPTWEPEPLDFDARLAEIFAHADEVAKLGYPSPYLVDCYRKVLEAGEHTPDIGAWPTTSPEDPGLTVACDPVSGEAIPSCHIVIIPDEDWTTAPAYLNWGNWNYCPAPGAHVTTLRSWRDRYDARLIGLGIDTMNIYVQRRPQTRDEALELAVEHYYHCSDLLYQDYRTLSNLAASLLKHSWWSFWWD